MPNYIDQIKAEFSKQATELALLPQLDETARQMKNHPQKAKAILTLKHDLLKLIDTAFQIELEMFRMSPDEIIASKLFPVLIDHVSERVINDNPQILKSLIRRDTAYHVIGQVYGAAKDFNPDQFIEDTQNNIVHNDKSKVDAWMLGSTRTEREQITEMTFNAFMDELDTLKEMYDAQPTGHQIAMISHIVKSKLSQQLKDTPQELIEDIVRQYAGTFRSENPPANGTVHPSDIPLNPKDPF